VRLAPQRRVQFVADSVGAEQSDLRYDATVVLPRDDIGVVIRGFRTHGRSVAELIRELFPECYRAEVGHTAEMRSPPGAELLLRGTLSRLNAALLARGAADTLFRGLAASLCAIAIEGDEAVIAHVGDCRAFVLTPDDELYLCTQDHTIARDCENMGQPAPLPPNDRRNFDPRGITTSVIGAESVRRTDIAIEQVHDRTVFLLCTPRLNDVTTQDELLAAAILARVSPSEASAQLRHLALSRQGTYDESSWVIVST
jgi:serine/threonine protein phosphatase PrpC